MDMSKAAMPAISGRANEADKSHPLYNEWRKYEAGCARNMINGQNFRDWLYQREQNEMRDDWAKHAQYPAFLSWMKSTKAGGRACRPTKDMPGGLNFPENFKVWIDGERW